MVFSIMLTFRMMLYAVTFLVNMTKGTAPVKILQMLLCYGGSITRGAFKNSVGANHGVKRDTFFKSAISPDALVSIIHMLLHILLYTADGTSVKRTCENFVLTTRIMFKPILSIDTLPLDTTVFRTVYVLKKVCSRTHKGTLIERTRHW